MHKGGLYLALGDSITVSQVTPGDGLYAHKIFRQIGVDYGDIRHVNKGLGGASTSDLVSNIRWLTGGMRPDLVTIGVGMNDCNSTAANKTTVANYTTNVGIIIDAIRYRNPKCHIICCTPSGTSDGNRTPTIQQYRDAMVSVAQTKGVDYVRFESVLPDAQAATYTGDGVHPNTAGHLQLYNLLYPVVQTGQWLNRLTKADY
ncbi:SGNH/GDSL hydrolase family protein [Paenibacillus sp. SI8]|uniref:SGNH/GDSL hydrolase family protein n=1 Tax=unclassified Paenibacillus TaxID=185978 RepID=UPI00346785B6